MVSRFYEFMTSPNYNKASFNKNGIFGGRGFLQASVTAHGCVTLRSGLGSKEVSWPILRPSSSITGLLKKIMREKKEKEKRSSYIIESD